MRNKTPFFVGVIAIAFFPAAIAASIWNQNHIVKTSIHIDRKERLMKVTDGKTTYTNFVYANGEAFVVQDSMWNGHWRAGTVYASIEEGMECSVTLSGHRFGFFSMYQNIIAADCQE